MTTGPGIDAGTGPAGGANTSGAKTGKTRRSINKAMKSNKPATFNRSGARTINVFETKNLQTKSAAREVFCTTGNKVGGANQEARYTIITVQSRGPDVNFALDRRGAIIRRRFAGVHNGTPSVE